MNTSNLEVDQVVKNYKELCGLLGVKVKGGDAKRAQMREIERYIAYKKQGYKFVITEIYEAPKPMVVNKKNDAYGGLIQVLLTDFFMKTGKNHLAHSASYLMQQIDMINDNYRYNKSNINEYLEERSIKKEVVHDFYDTTDSTLKSALLTALKNLENKALIMFTEEYIVKEIGSNVHRVATIKEKDVILVIRDSLLDELGYDSLRDALFSKSQHKFKARMKEELENRLSIEYAYKGYSINILQESIAHKQAKMIIKLLSEVESKNYKDELNSTVIKRLLQNAIKRAEKAIEVKNQKVEMGFGEPVFANKLNQKQLARTDDDYVRSIEKMINDNISKQNKSKIDEDTLEYIHKFLNL